MRDTIFTLKIVYDRFLTTIPYFGAVTIQREGREYILDVVQSYTYDDEDCEGATETQCDLEIDEDTFDECAYDLTIEDLLSDDVKAEFFIESDEEEFEIDRMLLFFEVDGERKSIKVTEE
jgi:hypothetical protein